MKHITSLQNAEIQALVKLADAKGRKQQQRFIAEGFNTCSTLINGSMELLQLYTTGILLEQAGQLAPESLITLVTDNVFKKISQAVSPSGILGVFKIPPTPNPEKMGPGIVLVNISDPGNMGTLIRSCAAFGKKTVIVIEGVDPWNAKVVQASAGTSANVMLFELTWPELLTHKRELLLCGLVATGGKNPKEVALNNALLVIGSEAHGIPAQWQKECDQLLSLPMPGHTESLNAAVAGSIAMYVAWI